MIYDKRLSLYVFIKSRSPVFRASILTDMQEASKGEIFVKEIGEKSLTTIIHLFTGCPPKSGIIVLGSCLII